jgi:predicted ester cyclase
MDCEPTTLTTTEGETPMSTQDRNMEIVRRYFEEWSNRGDEHVLNEVISPAWVSHGTQSAFVERPGLPRGVAGAKQLHDEVRSIWPDHQWTVEDLFASGDKVCARLTNRATHQGTYRGIPPTGKPVTFSSIWILRLDDGKIVEVWRSADDLSRVMQIGGRILPPED